MCHLCPVMMIDKNIFIKNVFNIILNLALVVYCGKIIQNEGHE